MNGSFSAREMTYWNLESATHLRSRRRPLYVDYGSHLSPKGDPWLTASSHDCDVVYLRRTGSKATEPLLDARLTRIFECRTRSPKETLTPSKIAS